MKINSIFNIKTLFDYKIFQQITSLRIILLIDNVNQVINKLIDKFFLMLDDLIYEQKGKISGYGVLDKEDPTIIKTTNTDNNIINGINVTEIVTYHRV
jgi:hypothetical protein